MFILPLHAEAQDASAYMFSQWDRGWSIPAQVNPRLYMSLAGIYKLCRHPPGQYSVCPVVKFIQTHPVVGVE